jgi:mRNA interferase MazF
MQILHGDVVWVDFGKGRGCEQSGIRPAVIVSSPQFLETVDSLVVVIPATTRFRDWPNHVELSGLTGLTSPTWAMTEQLRTVTRERVLRWSGSVDEHTFATIRLYLRDALNL